jgi:beta-phosphoglucomutase-like phosphatase (HAD superfamily)
LSAHEIPIVLEPGTFDAILFDCDGTLVESAPAWLLAINKALHTDAPSMPQDWYYARLGLSPSVLVDEYEAEFGPMQMPRADFHAKCVHAFSDSTHALEEVTIVADVARAWHGRIPMAVVSNAQRPAVMSSLTAVALLPLFDFLVTIDDVVHGKPAPDIYLKAAVQLEVDPSRCVVLEDSHEGMTAATRAGMQAIDIRNHWTPRWKR